MPLGPRSLSGAGRSDLIRCLLLGLLAWGLTGSAWAAPPPRFVLLPLDNRPCNLLFVRQVARQADAQVVAPPDHELGSFLNPGSCQRFPGWLEENLQAGDTAVVSSDMLCFGGLVGSRNALTTEKEALERLDVLRKVHAAGARLEVLATVPRLSLRTSDGEAPYETKLKNWAGDLDERPTSRAGYPADVPSVYVDEYLAVRQRNLHVLQRLQEMVKEGMIDKLVVGQDDSSTHGLHSHDQKVVREGMTEISERAVLLSGADELSMDMVSGRLAEIYDIHPKLSVEYSEPGSEKLIPPLESQPLEAMVAAHLKLCGAAVVESEEDVRVFVEVPSDKPFRLPDEEVRSESDKFIERVREWMVQGHRAAIADIALINRMNPFLAEAVLQRIPLTRLEGFAGWNTAANAFGTVIANVVVRRISDQLAHRWPIARVKESARAHLSFLLARLIDDYGYQALMRDDFYKEARGLPVTSNPFLSPYVPLGREVRVSLIQWARKLYDASFLGKRIELPGGRGAARLGDCRLEVVLPWPRLFEVEVRMDVELLPDR